MYSIIETIIESEGKQFKTYGVRCNECEVPDLSADRSAVQKLVEKCNRLNLSPCHLKDVAEDFIG